MLGLNLPGKYERSVCLWKCDKKVRMQVLELNQCCAVL
jgi:hypothetical protein